jgi:NAD-dependent deacetylase
MDVEDPCRRAGELLRDARRVVVLTGAGISTESGIPDFRSPGGLWSRYDPSKLTYDRFCASEETRRAYWEIACESYPVMRDAEPNAAHRAVVAIERAGKLSKLVTQNVDGLHTKAGNSVEKTIEIHGRSGPRWSYIRLLRCQKRRPEPVPPSSS